MCGNAQITRLRAPDLPPGKACKPSVAKICSHIFMTEAKRRTPKASKAGWRDRAVRWSDSAEHRPRPERRRRQDSRHQHRLHRYRRRPRLVPQDDGSARHSDAGKLHGHEHRRSTRVRQADRWLPGDDPPELRAWRPRHGSHLR